MCAHEQIRQVSSGLKLAPLYRVIHQQMFCLRASLIRRISNCRNRNRNRNLIGMQVTNCKGKIPSKERKNEVRLNCFLELFCIGIWLQSKISYRFPFMYSYESNAATVQISIGIEILHFSFKIVNVYMVQPRLASTKIRNYRPSDRFTPRISAVYCFFTVSI
jgi:hypothetical protein